MTFFSAFVLPGLLWAQSSQQINQDLTSFLQRMEANPKAAMQELPKKYPSILHSGSHSDSTPHSTSEAKTLPQPSLEDKQLFRKNFCKNTKCVRAPQTFAEVDSKNQVERFFPYRKFDTSIEFLFSKESQSAELESSPWSGDYWATYRLGIARRYADENYPDSRSLDDYTQYFSNVSPIENMNQEELNQLSPAEKYDLLVGDKLSTLTRWNIQNGQRAYNDEGKAQTWVGICHGWAPAAYMVDRPRKAVELPIRNSDLKLKFYPHDIKALVTQLWAQVHVPTRFLGSRCNNKEAKKDENGRITNPVCFDINPAAWHMALVNETKKYKTSFVFDATYDFEVWNQPIHSYEVVFFNPESKQIVQSYDKAMIASNDFASDPFKKYRSPKTETILGVSLRLSYVVETHPNQNENDSPDFDALKTLHYVYDLELDKDNQLIGGEWYQEAHPDFIWTPFAGAEPRSVTDHMILHPWSAELPPLEWTAAAQQSSAYGQPLAKVVEQLVELSQP